MLTPPLWCHRAHVQTQVKDVAAAVARADNVTRGVVRTQAMQKLETYRKLAADMQRQNKAEHGLGSGNATDGAIRALTDVRTVVVCGVVTSGLTPVTRCGGAMVRAWKRLRRHGSRWWRQSATLARAPPPATASQTPSIATSRRVWMRSRSLLGLWSRCWRL